MRLVSALGRSQIAIDIIEAEIRSTQQEVLVEASKLVLTGEPIEIARTLRDRADTSSGRLDARRNAPRPARRPLAYGCARPYRVPVCSLAGRAGALASSTKIEAADPVVLDRGLLRPRSINDLQSCPLEIVRWPGGHAPSQVI